MANFGDLITSKVRIKILELFFSNLKEIYHVRGIVREIDEEINAVRRELTKLEHDGILRKEPRGNRIYYSVRSEHPFYGDLISMISKTVGLGRQLIDNKNKIGKSGGINCATCTRTKDNRKLWNDTAGYSVTEENFTITGK